MSIKSMVARANEAIDRANAEAQAQRFAVPTGKISVVGDTSTGALACPRCGGTSFKVRRRTSTKIVFGAASLLGQAKHVRCVTCGAEYDRG